MAFASLDGLTFRINPSAIEWGFQIDTSVEETIGGRVVQVVGASLSDITLSGEYGERKGYRYGDKRDAKTALIPRKGVPLQSWELAEAFIEEIRKMMEKQSKDATAQDARLRPLDFKFPEYGWHFAIYIKGIDDGQSNQAIAHSSGQFAYKWRISMFIVEERSSALVLPGKGTSLADKQKHKAIAGYIARISNGVGWKQSAYNQPTQAAAQAALTGARSVTPGSGPTT